MTGETSRSPGCGLGARIAISAIVLAMLAGCASAIVKHSFSFNANEEPGIEILDYRYGDSRQPGARADHTQLRDGKVRQVVRMSGDIVRPEVLYVRWRVESSGIEYEDEVNLERLLPRDITDHRIHFTVRGA